MVQSNSAQGLVGVMSDEEESLPIELISYSFANYPTSNKAHHYGPQPPNEPSHHFTNIGQRPQNAEKSRSAKNLN